MRLLVLFLATLTARAQMLQAVVGASPATSAATTLVNSPFTGLANNANINTYFDPVSGVAYVRGGSSGCDLAGDGSNNVKSPNGD